MQLFWNCSVSMVPYNYHIHLMAFFPEQSGQDSTRKAKQFWILMKHEMMGWQWHQLDQMQIIYTLYKWIAKFIYVTECVLARWLRVDICPPNDRWQSQSDAHVQLMSHTMMMMKTMMSMYTYISSDQSATACTVQYLCVYWRSERERIFVQRITSDRVNHMHMSSWRTNHRLSTTSRPINVGQCWRWQ